VESTYLIIINFYWSW